MPDLSDARVLILAADGFEASELFKPREALLEEGAAVTLASMKTDPIQGTEHDQPSGEKITPDMTLEDANADDYDALLLPGGVANPDKLRMQDAAVKLVQAFFAANKPVAAICHGPWLLAEADVLKGRTLTSWPSIRTDLRNAGATVVDEEVHVDGKLVTSRKPDDIPAFNKAMLAAIKAG